MGNTILFQSCCYVPSLYNYLYKNLCFQEWHDDRLLWDPAEYGGLEDIIVKADRLWLPELAVMNGCVMC